MVLVDIHSHLDFEHFDNDRNEIVSQMRKNEIMTLVNTTSPENYIYAKELFKNDSDVVKVCPGLYPIDAEKISDEEFQEYLNEIRKIKDLVAIGEVGLDLKHGSDEKGFEMQVRRFKVIIELAIELNKPLIIHTWAAERQVLGIIEEYIIKTSFRKFVLHSFTGKKKLVCKIRDLKIYASIPLMIERSQNFQILVEELPITKLFVETDSPFLNPDKERNSPLNIPRIYDKIAEIKGYDRVEIVNIIYNNYQKLFI